MELAPGAPVQALHGARGAASRATRSSAIEGVDLDAVAICCDLDSHVFFAEHTDPAVADALRASHWFDLREWVERSPGADAA